MIKKLLALNLFYCVCAMAQSPVLWNGMPRGPYEIGFKFERQFDHARPYQNQNDEQSQPVAHRGRPVQMFIWYPAEAGSNAKPMRYEEYLYLNDTDSEPWQWREERKQAVLQNYAQELEPFGGNLQPLLATATAAMKDTKAATGKFPLVIFGAGGGTGGHVYSVLCEYLASHGYVAIAHTALGLQKGERWPFDMRGIETQLRDLNSILNYAHRLPNVDAGKLALASWSVGGVAQALLQMQNADVDAILSLDAATGYEYGRDLLRQSPWFDLKKMTVPYLHMHGELPQRYNVPKNFEYFDSLSVAEAYMLSFKKLVHADFIASYGAVSHTLTKSERSVEAVESYKIVCQYALNFLSAYLKDDNRAKEFLRQTPSSLGLAEVLSEVKMKLEK
ncbi:hypothetical protein EDS67_21055 [candidate division KSB1 bacterium]|nr:MAG: hypothetical protein EDS67_21055 [candidate division KSB1 bacterium]MBC6947778.1 hypothetical protein [candidate division KSB1 bacterium]MCE7943504.1 hypothetical protein [Chlorobi bacterium CHB1]MDL1878170.1 hypothetical protein [Cytophagia bacterium CHB2]